MHTQRSEQGVLPMTCNLSCPLLAEQIPPLVPDSRGSRGEMWVIIASFPRSGPATSMETLDAKGWKPHGYHPPLARAGGKRHELIPGLSCPFPAPLILPAWLDVASQAVIISRSLFPGSLSTYLALSDTNRFKPLGFSERSLDVPGSRGQLEPGAEAHRWERLM